MQTEDDEHLRHMLDCAQEAMSYAAVWTRAGLDSDRILALALVNEIEIIGEAAFRMSDDARATLAKIPWPENTGMRHRLVHAYFEIDHDIFWDTVKQNLPPLIAVLEAGLKANPQNQI